MKNVSSMKVQKKYKILIVDDEETICNVLEVFFSRGGHKVQTLNNGAEAIALIKEEYFDLVLCDIAMPDVYGYDVISALNKLNKRPKIGVITGGSKLKPLDEEGFNVDFITKKPFYFSMLTKQINTVMGAGRRKYVRIEKSYNARFRIKPDETQDLVSIDWDMVAINNLGAGGVFFHTRRSMEIGTTLDLKIDFSTSTPDIKCDGRVTRTKRHLDTSIFGIAIEFTEIDEHIKGIINKTAILVDPNIQFLFNTV